jgi:apolipoprotein N-acyltransferase
MPRGRRSGLIAAAVGAALTALALPRTSFWPLGWFGLVPFFVALNRALTRREAATVGLVAGLAYHAVVLHWIYDTCLFARVPALVAGAALAALSLALAVNWALIGSVGFWLSQASARQMRPWIWAIVWTAVSAVCTSFTPRLAVDLWSYTQGPNLALLQAGAWGGPHAVGFLLLLVNAALAEAWLETGGPTPLKSQAAAPVAAAFALAAGVWLHGAFVLINRPAPSGPTARVEILQPAIDQYQKWDASAISAVLLNYEDLLSLPRKAAPALVVWPETAIPRWTPRGEAAPEVARWAKILRAEHLVGVIARDPANGVQLVGVTGRVEGFYAKRELVPFGEYVPFRRFIPDFVVSRWLQVLDQLGDMGPGAKQQPLPTTVFGPTAVTICYEAMFPRWARGDAARGARMLVNVTNDAWYKDTWGPYQHFAVNALRAVENRTTVIRAGNTGISAVIDPWGVVVAQLPLNVRGRLDVDVPLTDSFQARSFYARHGDLLGAACALLTLTALFRRAMIRL